MGKCFDAIRSKQTKSCRSPNMKNYLNIHPIPRFCLKLRNEAERTFKYRWTAISTTIDKFYVINIASMNFVRNFVKSHKILSHYMKI